MTFLSFECLYSVFINCFMILIIFPRTVFISLVYSNLQWANKISPSCENIHNNQTLNSLLLLANKQYKFNL